MIRRAFIVSVVIAGFILIPGFAYALEGDVLPTSNGPLVIHPILHGTFAMQWQGKIIYVDPFGGEQAFLGLERPDLVLITDIHGDHMSPATLEVVLQDATRIVAPSAVQEQLPEAMKGKTSVIDNGESIELLGLTITAMPMYNLPETPESRHPKGRGNGYVIEIGGKRVYISGDTHDIPEMRSLKHIDIAFVCMNPPNTMSMEQAADAVLAFKPAIVYPFHFRSRSGLSDVEGFKRIVSANKNIEVRLRSWYPQSN